MKPDEEEVRRLYNEGNSLNDLADEYGVSSATVYRWMDDWGIERRSISVSTSMAAGSYYDIDLRVDKDGYIVFNGTAPDSTGYTVRIHRLAAVAWFGYDAVVDYDVHHLNGVPFDNRQSNITVMEHGEHASEHEFWDDASRERERDDQGRFSPG